MSVTCRSIIVALGLLSLCIPTRGVEAVSAQHRAAIIRLEGEIDDFKRDNLFRNFREAEAAGATTVIIEFNTPGGMVASGMDISRFLRGQTNIHTIAYINTSAYSAGTLIAMACDEIVMSPSSVVGDCAPIVLGPGGLKPLPATERAKIQSPLLQDFSQSCQRNHYNQLIAQAMVRVNSSIYLIEDKQGRDRPVTKTDYRKVLSGAYAKWKPAPISQPVNAPDTLLTVGPDLARRLGICKGTARSSMDLASQRGLTIVADLRPGFGDHLVEFLNGYPAKFTLLVVFLLSLYICLHAPGHGAAEAVAIFCLGILVGIPVLTGYAQWWEILLILIGLGLCAFEILVFPGHGLSLGLGMIMMMVGLLLTFAGKDLSNGWLPDSQQAWHRMGNGVLTMAGAIATAVVIALLLLPLLPKLPFFNKLILTETSGGPVAAAGAPLKAGDDSWPFIGTVGVAATDLKPGGIVKFPYGADTRSAAVVSTGAFIEAGRKVIVQEARGNRITVKAV